jgi:hypothetical protein
VRIGKSWVITVVKVVVRGVIIALKSLRNEVRTEVISLEEGGGM